jgi:hypothetical protein
MAPTLACDQGTHITTQFNFRARAVRVALFQFVLPTAFRQRILPNLYTDKPRSMKGSLVSPWCSTIGPPLRTCDRYCERPRGINTRVCLLKLKRSLHRSPTCCARRCARFSREKISPAFVFARKGTTNNKSKRARLYCG